MPNGKKDNIAWMVISAEDGVVISVNMTEDKAKEILEHLQKFIQEREGLVGAERVNWNSAMIFVPILTTIVAGLAATIVV